MRIAPFTLIATLLVAGMSYADADKPHLVFIVGTLHYSPELTIPAFAEALEGFGFRSTVVMGDGDPERKPGNVLPGIEALANADAAVFFTRFLTLPDAEWKPIEAYLKSGKPVIGLRTANHAFKYAKTHPRYDWNDDFGRRALGSPYIVHQGGTTDIKVVSKNASHPIMTHVTKTEWVSLGTLYLARMEEGCLPLLTGSGKGRARLLKKRFGEIQVKKFETAAVAWAWQNEWGGKSVYSSLGHPGDFAEESFVRMLINSICWATNRPLPAADAKIPTWTIERVDKRKKKN
jgi:type 1 glutamine amidotransferase